jgi:hypothetical protein
VPPDAEPAEVRPAPPADVVALLGALEGGERVAGWEVIGIAGPDDRLIRVDLRREDHRFSIMVARIGVRSERPPVTTDLYAIYYGHTDPPGTKIPDGAVRAITHAFARRIAATEHDVPIPNGM